MTYYKRFDGMLTADEYVKYAKENQPCVRTSRGWYDVYNVCDDSIVNIGRAVIDEGYTSFGKWSDRLKKYLLKINNQFTNENMNEISVEVWDCYFEEKKGSKLKISEIAKKKRNLFLRIVQSKALIYLSISLIVISQLFLSLYNKVDKDNLHVMVPMLQLLLTPMFYLSLTKYMKIRYYLIPLIMIAINIIYLFITYFFISYIPHLKFLFILSSTLLVLSSIILAFNNEDFIYKKINN
jgi:hypothetical protein